MACDPATLVREARCLQSCLSKGMELPALIYLFCQIVDNGGTGGGGLLSGTGSPEGAVVSDVGGGYVQTDGGGSFWIKITGAGNTGWVQISSATSGPQLYTGAASPEGAVTAIVGSVYTQIVAGVYTATWYKVTGAGNTGWF